MSELIFLLAGCYGILLLLGSAEGIIFSLGLLWGMVTVLSSVLWAVYHRSRKAFVVLLISGILLWSLTGLWQQELLLEQGRAFVHNFRAGMAAENSSTELIFMAMSLWVLLLFLLEYVVKWHWAAYLFTSVLMLSCPLLGVRLTVGAIFLIAVYQASFWIPLGLFNSRRIVLLLLVAAFAIGIPVSALFSEELFGFAYDAEEAAYRTRSRLTGQNRRPITGGHINRGNNYRMGTEHLELVTSEQPEEMMYLRGFSGGNYENGDWELTDDTELFRRVGVTLHWGNWSNWIQGMYYSAYYAMNGYMLTQDPPTPISLMVTHSGGIYENAYMPYYSQRLISWEDSDYDPLAAGYGGYLFRFYEQGDMHLDWDNISSQVEQQRNWYRDLLKAYNVEAQEAYTQVPEEGLPRMRTLVEENPLTDVEEITTFILYTIHQNAEYSLTPGWAPFQGDLVEYFLFDGGQGYCEHFASAATLLYRLYGVPARYATGYRVYPEDFVLQEDGSWQAVATDEDAHAWVEILLPEYGWTPIEATPALDGSSVISFPGMERTDFERVIEAHRWNIRIPGWQQEGEEEEIPRETQESSEAFSVPEISWDQYRGFFWVIGTCLVYSLLLLPLFMDYRKLRRQERIRKMDTRDIFGELLKLLHRRGFLVDYQGNEGDFAEKLTEALPVISKEEAEKLLEIVYRAAYGPRREGASDGYHAEIDHQFVLVLYERIAALPKTYK